jgi:hypothetical protein
MTYTPGIPNSTDLISNSQQQIKDNFGQLNTQFAIDHVAFNTGAANGDGHHKQVTFDNAPSAPTTTGTVSCVYPVAVTSNVGGVSVIDQQLYFKALEYSGTGSAAQVATQLTGYFLKSANGYATLPGGILVKWGSFSASSGNGTFSYPTGATIPVFTTVYQVFLQPSSAPGSPNYYGYVTGTPGAASFTYDSVARTSNTGASGTYSYLAIGV